MAASKTLTRNAIRKTVGGRAFTVAEFAAATGLSYITARRAVLAAAEAGAVQDAGVRPTGLRGRPSHLFKVAR